jgi:molecular chaperone HscB
MTSITNRNYFELFRLEPRFQLDLRLLDTGYKELQGRVHPDRAVHLGDAERRLSLQWATFANEAYRTLKRPLDRARYLLGLRGVDTQEETLTALPQEFLLEQMEWREQLQEAAMHRDVEKLKRLERQVQGELKGLLERLGTLLDVEHCYEPAAALVRQMRFLDKLSAEINDACEALEH